MKAKFNFTITGFILALILIGMFAAVFGVLSTQLQEEYGIVGNA